MHYFIKSPFKTKTYLYMTKRQKRTKLRLMFYGFEEIIVRLDAHDFCSLCGVSIIEHRERPLCV